MLRDAFVAHEAPAREQKGSGRDVEGGVQVRQDFDHRAQYSDVVEGRFALSSPTS